MQKKGRSGLAGLALGALLGVFGLLIAACLSDKKRDELRIAEINATAAMAEAAAASARAAARQLDAANDTKVCPRCAETVKAAALVCRYCRHEFTAEPA
ncbi:zinc ribbon domain-containing protein [Ancylobacter lacus]|uniref:zinc ribbon domain-containing protein n=1 Tax=Ancylobacter lacus TaxID=2579970 RepID=UPI001BCAD7E5|nr:zinc ribbon domain-containing protein [Ancylobacter lacus]